ncbi:MAG TPA: hypothetical protein VFU27_05805 [Terriglobales bacterium]|nr:hypothetical protein [Terriglobales bacterium]
MSFRPYVAGLILATLASAPLWGQRPESNWPSPPRSAQQIPGGTSAQRRANLDQLQRAAEQHKAQLEKDTERLGQLVTELRQELDKTPAGTLSMSAVKKSKEVEKLAKRVRKEMEGD